MHFKSLNAHSANRHALENVVNSPLLRSNARFLAGRRLYLARENAGQKRFGTESRLADGRESTNFAGRLLNTTVASAVWTLAALATLCAAAYSPWRIS